jgi:hypothetical protein
LAQPNIYNLTVPNSVARVNVNSDAGMFSWSIQNSPTTQLDQLNKQWFYYRVGPTGGEAPINSISAAAVTVLDAATLTTKYTDSANRFNVSVKYSLTGGSATSGIADMGEQITINNTSGSVLDYHFFQYSDFNLGYTPNSDTLVLSKNPFTGLFNQADQINGPQGFVETVNSPGANHGEAAAAGVTLARFNSGTPTTLNDNTTAVGDVAWALEWDLTIDVGGSALISKDKVLHVQFIPEPASLALVGLGLGLFTWRARRKA